MIIIYTIIMEDDKSLTTSVKTTIYQREKLVDKIQFLFPLTYGGLDLSKFSVQLKYIDQANVAHMEELVLDENVYESKTHKKHKNCSSDQHTSKKLRYVLPVDTNLTQFAGDITIRITLTWADEENQKVYVLHTGENTITINPLSDYYAFIDDDSLEEIDQKMLELDAMIDAATTLAESLDENKLDDLVVEDDKISGVANGKKKTEWLIGVPHTDDGTYDGDRNGIIEL